MTRKEKVFVIEVALILLLITSLPYIYGYYSAPSGRQFLGVMLDVPDHYQYFSWMRDFSTANFSANKLTPEPNQPVFFNLLWWMMAKMDNVLRIGFGGMLQLLRWIVTPIFLLGIYQMCCWYFENEFQRKATFLSITLMSGLGWTLVIDKYLTSSSDLIYPLDVNIAEGNTFLGILGYPHFIGAALYIFIFILIILGQKRNQYWYAVGAGLVALFLGWQHAYDLLSVYSVILCYAILLFIRDRKLPIYIIISGIVVGVISVWPAIYSVLLTSLDPIWKAVLGQFGNAGVFTPTLPHLVILFGFPLILALITIILDKPWGNRNISDVDLFLIGWFGVTFIIIYLPVDYQIHLLNGWQVPMGILAMRGVFRYGVPWISQHWVNNRSQENFIKLEKVVSIFFIGLISLTNIYHICQRFVELNRHTYPYYISTDDSTAMRWLDDNVKDDDVILSSLTIGQYLPASTGAHAFLAHWAQTVDFFTKEDLVDAFFSSSSTNDERQKIIDDYGVDYVYWGSEERLIGGFDPDNWSMLEKVYSTPSVDVFQVNQ